MDKVNYIPDVVLILPAFVLYIITWAVTLALAFTSLGDLLLGAYEIIHWTNFFGALLSLVPLLLLLKTTINFCRSSRRSLTSHWVWNGAETYTITATKPTAKVYQPNHFWWHQYFLWLLGQCMHVFKTVFHYSSNFTSHISAVRIVIRAELGLVEDTELVMHRSRSHIALFQRGSTVE